MSYKNMLYVVVMIGVLPLAMNGMNCALALSKKKGLLRKPVAQRSFFASAGELRNKIATPLFSAKETDPIISALPIDEADGCKKNGLIEYIVYKATEFNQYESKYATVLHQLRNQGWKKSRCCVDVMLHSAVISNLPNVVDELLKHDDKWVHARDMHDCIPLHYAQSTRIARSLLQKGSSVDAKDKQGNTPLHMVPSSIVSLLIGAETDIHAQHALLNAENELSLRIPNHGWQSMTPLRKAVDEGDWDKCHELIYADIHGYFVGEQELKILIALASLRRWRTEEVKFVNIKTMLSNYKRYHYEEKH